MHRTNLKFSTAYTQQQDGQTERVNKLLEEILRCNAQPDQMNWLELVDGAVAAINSTPSSSTGMSPFEIETGLTFNKPVDTQLLADQTYENRGTGGLVRATMAYDDQGNLADIAPFPALYEYGLQQQHRFDHPERMRAIFQTARDQLEQARRRLLQQQERQRIPDRRFQVGDYVSVDLTHYRFAADSLGPSKKLNMKFAGSFPVVAVHSPRASEIRRPSYAHGLIHPVIHPMYLKLATNKSVQKGLKKLIERHFDQTYEIDRILAHRTNDKGELQYLVQWQQCGPLQEPAVVRRPPVATEIHLGQTRVCPRWAH